MRLFVALPVPATARDSLAAATAPLHDAHPGLRWTRPEGWHLTVAFLGEVPDDRVDDVAAVVEDTAPAHPAVTLTLGAAGRFGRRVLWVGIDEDPPGTAAALGADVQGRLAAADLPVQQRDVHPHLTLARAGRRGPVDDGAVADVEVPAVSWEADEVTLWHSRLGRGGARYERVVSAPLGA